MAGPVNPIEAIDRAVAILQALGQAGPQGITLAELTKQVGQNKSTLYRALYTLRLRDFVQQSPDGRYSLGGAALALSAQFFSGENLPQLLAPALAAICAVTDHTVHLGILVGTQMLYVDKVEPEHTVQVRSRIGQTIPAATSAMGRAVLAQIIGEENQLLPYLEAASHAQDLSAKRLWAELEKARERGYASEIEENEAGVVCIGIALKHRDRTVGAISITALASQLDAGAMDATYQRVREVLVELLPAGLEITLPRRATARGQISGDHPQG